MNWLAQGHMTRQCPGQVLSAATFDARPSIGHCSTHLSGLEKQFHPGADSFESLGSPAKPWQYLMEPPGDSGQSGLCPVNSLLCFAQFSQLWNGVTVTSSMIRVVAAANLPGLLRLMTESRDP